MLLVYVVLYYIVRTYIIGATMDDEARDRSAVRYGVGVGRYGGVRQLSQHS